MEMKRVTTMVLMHKLISAKNIKLILIQLHPHRPIYILHVYKKSIEYKYLRKIMIPRWQSGVVQGHSFTVNASACGFKSYLRNNIKCNILIFSL